MNVVQEGNKEYILISDSPVKRKTSPVKKSNRSKRRKTSSVFFGECVFSESCPCQLFCGEPETLNCQCGHFKGWHKQTRIKKDKDTPSKKHKKIDSNGTTQGKRKLAYQDLFAPNTHPQTNHINNVHKSPKKPKITKHNSTNCLNGLSKINSQPNTNGHSNTNKLNQTNNNDKANTNNNNEKKDLSESTNNNSTTCQQTDLNNHNTTRSDKSTNTNTKSTDRNNNHRNNMAEPNGCHTKGNNQFNHQNKQTYTSYGNDILRQLPSALVPIYLKKYLNKLDFQKRFVIEMFISTGDLCWNDFNRETIECFQDLDIKTFVKNISEMANNKNEMLQKDKEEDEKKVGLNLFSIVAESTSKNAGKKALQGTFDLNGNWSAPNNFCLAINAKVSADKIIFLGPYAEQKSRFTRQFSPDRFLRVSFVLPKKHCAKAKQLFGRVMKEGITLAGRHYQFLCFSASQLRTAKCNFFASTGYDIEDSITAQTVREWAGDFSCINSVSKLAARMGQAFSKTTPTIQIPPSCMKEIPDIEVEDPKTGTKYIFTDGCGEISGDYLEQIASIMNLNSVPSAIQVRLMGMKGMLVLNPQLTKQIRYVPSMKKYDIENPTPLQRTVEVIKTASVLRGYLNRQYINILSCLGVPNEFFLKLQQAYIDEILNFHTSKPAAKNFLTCLTPSKELASLSNEALRMLLAGHDPDEPHLVDILRKIKKGQLTKLKRKARIPLSESRLLLGVADHSQVLEENQVFIKVRLKDAGLINITGPVAICRNPCLHPGDFRVLTAVNEPSLKHLVDVLVFPTKGNRPHADKIAGGDLDGDMFTVIWDTEVVSKITEREPSDYTAVVKELPVPNTNEGVVDALIKQFLNQTFNSSLGEISYAHTIVADKFGLDSPHAIDLAHKFSRAVDAAKTGDVVTLGPAIQQLCYKVPHYMAEDFVRRPTYKSTSILGLLYNQVEDAWRQFTNQTEQNEEQLQMDQDLMCTNTSEKVLTYASYMYRKYNKQMRHILATYTNPSLVEIHCNQVKQKLREEFDAKFTEHEDRVAYATAFYYVSYKDGQTKKRKTPPTFAWELCGDILNNIKANKNKTTTQLAPAIHFDQFHKIRYMA